MIVVVLASSVAAACGATGHSGSVSPSLDTNIELDATTTTVPTAPSIPSNTTTGQVTATSDELSEALAIAERFLAARHQRDIAATQAFLSDGVVLDWGPGTTYDTLADGWKWEDIFGITSDPRGCEIVEADSESIRVFCKILVQTAVNEARGNSAGIDCVHISIEDDLIIRAQLGVPGPDCVFDYWSTSFAPFEAWLGESHPDTTMDAMYDDRLSPEGLALWDQYVTEYLASQTR